MAGQRFQVGVAEGFLLGGAARVVVLDDDGGGAAKFGGEAARGFEIDEIIVGKLLALKLLGGGEAFWRAAGGDVERRRLGRGFAVAKFLLRTKSQGEALGQHWFLPHPHLTGAS